MSAETSSWSSRTGILKDSDASFTITEDGRFVGSKVSVTGVGTKLVTGLVGIVTTGLGIAAGVASKVAGAVAFATPAIGAPAEEEAPADKAYTDTFPELSTLRKRLRAAVATASTSKADAAAALASAAPTAIPAASAHLRASTLALDTLRSELERVDKHFAAWRATTMSSRVESYEFLLTIEELITAGTYVEGGQVKYQAPPDQFIGPVHETSKAEAQRLWNTLGIAVTVVDPLGPIKPPWANIPNELRSSGSRGLVVHLPRTVTLDLYKQDSPGGPCSCRPVRH